MGYNGLQWVKLGSTRVDEVLPGFTGFHLASSQSISTTSIHHVGPSDAGMRFNENLNCGFTCLFHFLFFFRSSVSFVPFGWIAGIFLDSRFFFISSFLFFSFFFFWRNAPFIGPVINGFVLRCCCCCCCCCC